MPLPPINTEAGIFNLALSMAGQRQFILDFTDDSTEAEIGAINFPHARDTLLEAHPWRFARKVAALTITTEAPVEWAAAYAAPTDMLKPTEIWPGRRRPGPGEEIPFTYGLNENGDGFNIFCDLSADATLVYTARCYTVALWTTKFREALAAELAVRVAAGLPILHAIVPMLQQRAALALQAARAADVVSATDDRQPEAESITVRG